MTSPVLWSLIVVQLALGLFDIVYHHELTERLPWRRSQRHEMRLHGVRNLAYAALFFTLGLFEPHGVWAMLVIAVLVGELVVTLMDFVEEDVSRKLPATERVTHTLLAINYGAILALLVPVLAGWAGEPSAIVPVWYGIGSVLAPLAALGVIVFGLRDFFAARRAERLVLGNAAELVGAL
ncbi:MAG TPA: TIGR01777 family protein, partial [Xanthobacteraceae bacterium]|nr:TIGR01777 family protein [Xanthobacteraceae bacterium]